MVSINDYVFQVRIGELFAHNFINHYPLDFTTLNEAEECFNEMKDKYSNVSITRTPAMDEDEFEEYCEEHDLDYEYEIIEIKKN